MRIQVIPNTTKKSIPISEVFVPNNQNPVTQAINALTNNQLADGVGGLAASVAAQNYAEAGKTILNEVIYAICIGVIVYEFIIPLGKSFSRLLP
jgi:hypothetical protein